MYDFYEEPRHLNIKKVIIISIIFVIIVVSITLVIVRKFSTQKEDDTNQVYETSTVFSSDDNSVSVELSNNLNLKKYDSGLDYLLELRSENNLNIFISKEDVMQNKSLLEVIEADKLAFLSNFDTYSNLSDTKELNVGNNSACTYSFHYYDKNMNTAFYLQIIWLQVDNNYYIFDIDFPLDDLSFNSSIATSLLSTFKVN